MNEPNLVILAGGISSRMKKSLTEFQNIDDVLLNEAQNKSKAMISIGSESKPFLDYSLANIQDAGYRDIVIVVGEQDNSITEYYHIQNNAKLFPNLTLSYVIQNIPAGRTKPVGTADALLIALQSKPEWKNQSFTVCNSDNLYSVEAFQLLLHDTHQNSMIDYDRDHLQFHAERTKHFAVIQKDENAYLVNLTEKPTVEQIAFAKDKSGRIGVSMNIFRLSYNMIYPFLESIPIHPQRNEKELPIAVKMMIEQYPLSVYTIPLSEHVPDLTSLKDLPDVIDYLQGGSNKPER